MDENQVKQIIESLGGAKVLMNEMDEYQEVITRMREERPNLVVSYPDQWVAIGREGVLGVGNSLDEVLGQVEALGVNTGEVVIEFMETDPPLQILPSHHSAEYQNNVPPPHRYQLSRRFDLSFSAGPPYS